MSVHPISRSLGSTERALRALLDRELAHAQLSFPQWTALVFTAGKALSAAQLIEQQLAAHIVSSPAQSQASLQDLLARELLQHSAALLTHSAQGQALYAQLSASVAGISQRVYHGLPAGDLDITQRTLAQMAERAQALLAAPASGASTRP